MADTYRISAAPLLFTEGAHKGRLSGATFTATSATGTREWFTINCGQFEDAFTRLMSRSRARVIVAALMEGDRTEFPGLYTARCETAAGAGWLQVTKATGASDRRPVVAEDAGADWGYHTDDVNLALGNLVLDVSSAESSFSAAHPKSR